MKKELFISLCLLTVTIPAFSSDRASMKNLMITQQSTKEVTGTIVDQDGAPVIGASVFVEGTKLGGVTDIDGNFSIKAVPSSAKSLRVTYIGMLPKTVAITNGHIRIEMQEDSKRIDEVVVTALGIQKKEKSLTYSTQIVKGDELTRAKDANMMNALAGKAAGVQITKSAGGLGGSSKVIIRGNRSVSGSNQPLYVIDGVPYPSSTKDIVGDTWGGSGDAANIDMGDGISNLNPDDIESMNILKGPAAAALYGSDAANGVVIITTKKGKVGRTTITYDNNTTFDHAAYGIPEFQNHYTGKTSSWGSKINGSPDYTKGFFQTGVTTINSLSLSAGSEMMQTYFSYANTYGKGTEEGNSLIKHNFNFRETANFFNKKLNIDANINAMYQRGNNRTSTGGYYMNPLVGLYHFPRGGVEGGESLQYYKDNYEVFDASRNMMTQNWYPGAPTDIAEQNPYWLLHKIPNQDERYRATFNLALKYTFNDMFSLQARGSADFTNDHNETRYYAGTSTIIAASNGRYRQSGSYGLDTYADLIFSYKQDIGSLALNASVGASISDWYGRGNTFENRHKANLYYPNVFSLSNMDLNNGYISEYAGHSQNQSVFLTAQVGWNDQLFLDLTGRNDWTSSLAFTDYKNKGFFYPSIGLTWILNQTLKLPEWITMGKIRGAWSQVGSGLSSYISNPKNYIDPKGTVDWNTTAPFGQLKPEKTTSVEFGTEWHLFAHRLDFDFTYYHTNTRNQLFELDAPSGSAYNTYYVNAGNIENYGIEIMLSGTPVMSRDWTWKTGINYALNRNKALSLAEGLERFEFTGSGSINYASYLEEGGSFGDIYGTTFKRDENGKIEYDSETGLPYVVKDKVVKIGNASPKFNLSWSNTISYKDFCLYFLIDGRFGGDVVSMTRMDLDAYGVSKATGDDRDRGYVMLEGTKITDVEGFYTLVGGRAGVTEHYVESATNIRLREVSLSYDLPKSIFRNGFVKGINLSLIARNLFFIKNNASFDPDNCMSTKNKLAGVEMFGVPSNRSMGFNVKVNF